MNYELKRRTVLVAEDDPDDRQWIKEALAECQVVQNVLFVEDGEQLMDFLLHHGKYASPGNIGFPGLILLDLNMPKKDGREALKEIKTDPRLRHIPVVILTTSKAEEDTSRTYSLGANTVIHKPLTFDELVEIMRSLANYWFETAEMPL
jgi:CheY-like chemotaxis protein